MTTRVGLYRDKRNKGCPWVVRWFGEYDPAKGKQRHYSKSFARKRDAEVFQTAKQAELDQGAARDLPVDITLADFCDSFLSTYCQDLRLSTQKLYRETLKQLKNHFGPNTFLRLIGPEAADRFIASRKRVAKQGKGFSIASRNKHLRQCKTIFKVAVQWGYLRSNPFDHIRLKRFSPRDWHHLKPKEFQALLAVANDLRWRTFYLLAYTTGGRFGELFNLTWADIDFERGRVTIKDRPPTEETPLFCVKDHETRSLLLPRQTLDALLAWQAEAPEEVPFILLTAERWQRVKQKWDLCRASKPWKKDAKTGELEPGEWENRFMINNVLRNMRSHVEKAGIELETPLTLHTLRKSFAQNHADSGTPSATLKALMGHASITTTEQYYLQRSDENEKAATRRYETLLADTTCVKLAYEPSEDEQEHPPQYPLSANLCRNRS